MFSFRELHNLNTQRKSCSEVYLKKTGSNLARIVNIEYKEQKQQTVGLKQALEQSSCTL